MFERVLVANRGEIAVRVMRTLARLGIEAVAVCSDADADAPHVRAADRTVRLGPAPAADSYLRIDRVVDAALRTGAQAVHPGYGLLSERADFARACAAAGLTFVGPGSEAIALLGDKAAAKDAAVAAGVPVVPGLQRADLSDAEIVEWAIGQDLPLLLKAAAGGGGRGMRVVRSHAELPDAIAAARREAQAAFGADGLLVERYLDHARHVEIQVLADEHGDAVHLGERECSLQRRHQKLIEESPSPAVGAELRERMGAAALSLVRGCGYTNAGTVELLVGGDEFFFLELNARLQVEHPVTELVTGLDLVELQLRIAAGEPLGLRQEDVELDGHAIEARVCAEDPANGFLPSTGRIVAYREPAGARVDSGVETGTEVSAHYDSMLAKVVVHGRDRDAALRALRRALAELRVIGPVTNAAYLRALLDRPEVRAGELDTGLVERLGAEVAPTAPAPELPALAAIALAAKRSGDDPWDARDGWRPGGVADLVMELDGPAGRSIGRARPLAADAWALAIDVNAPLPEASSADAPPAEALPAQASPADAPRPESPPTARFSAPRADGETLVVEAGGVARFVDAYRDGDAVWLVDVGVPTRWAPLRDNASRDAAGGSLDAPMPGVVLDVRAAAGASVAEGDVLVVLESMKMELAVVSPADGVVGEVHVRAGDHVTQGQALVAVEAA
jgi:3-methylcrotonyl-CoA carboxylase alpha subunit